MPPHAFDALCINDFYTSSQYWLEPQLFDTAEPEMHFGSGFGTGFGSGANIIWNTREKMFSKNQK
jgi:hypothetical protein